MGVNMVRLIGFTTLACGCVSGEYQEKTTGRRLHYIEQKGESCKLDEHQVNVAYHGERLKNEDQTSK